MDDDEIDDDEEEEEEDSKEENEDSVSNTQTSPDSKSSVPPITLKSAHVELQANADTCSYYDIIPRLAVPHSCSINAITATSRTEWLFTGGEDGYIRKFDFIASMNGKAPLTLAQRHSMVDTIVRGGYVLNYWESEQPPPSLTSPYALTPLAPAPVYSLAVHSRGLWLCSGTQSGAINLQTIRHDEGKAFATLRDHTAPVSAMALAHDEKSLLSGSWDRQICHWDLNTGQVIRKFGPLGQISTLEWRPIRSDPVPLIPRIDTPSDTLQTSTNNHNNINNDDDLKHTSPGSTGSFDPLFDVDEVIQQQQQPSEPTSTRSSIASEHIFMATGIDGVISLFDIRSSTPIKTIQVTSRTPPWCMNATWSHNGDRIFAGRRNCCIEEYSIHSSLKEPSRQFRLPANSGPVSALAVLPNDRHILCASVDNLRLYDVNAAPTTTTATTKKTTVPFTIIPGHHGGTIASIYVDSGCRFAVTIGGNRGWEGTATELILGHEIMVPS